MISSIQELSRSLEEDYYMYVKIKKARPPCCCDWWFALLVSQSDDLVF